MRLFFTKIFIKLRVPPYSYCRQKLYKLFEILSQFYFRSKSKMDYFFLRNFYKLSASKQTLLKGWLMNVWAGALIGYGVANMSPQYKRRKLAADEPMYLCIGGDRSGIGKSTVSLGLIMAFLENVPPSSSLRWPQVQSFWLTLHKNFWNNFFSGLRCFRIGVY